MEMIASIKENIDYKQTRLQDRMNIVENILTSNDESLTNYFSDSYTPNLTSKNSLSEEDNVCRTLESLANYILNSDEVKEMKAEEEFKYVFHTDEQYFNKKMSRENSIEGMSTGSDEDTVIHFLTRSKKNYKKSKTQVISKKDLKREGYVGDVLRDYNAELERISALLKRDNVNAVGSRYLLTRASGQIKTDMITVKDQLLGTFGYNANSSESTEYDLEVIDYTNPAHIEALLENFCDFEPNSDLAFIVMGFEEMASKTELTEHERRVYNFLRQGMTKLEISIELKVTTQQAGRLVRLVAKKVAKYYQENEI